MKSKNNQTDHQGGMLLAFLQRLGKTITAGPVLGGMMTLIFGTLLAYAVWQTQSQVSSASANQQTPVSLESEPSSTPTLEATPTETAPSPSNTLAPQPSPTIQAQPTPLPSATPTLPASALISGMKGHPQSKPLSCEARSAVDWAAYFGREIEEDDFFQGLPSSDNPEEGFVGNVNGSWGQIPPEDYGVHARPVAQRLREYGLKAKDLRHMTLEELKREIAQGKPVIVWVVGHVKRGTPMPYTASNGEKTIVAKFEHTVIVIGYTETKITVQDGARVYSIYEGEFMKSWNVLENQAVIWID